MPIKIKVVFLQPQTDKKWFVERRRICVILQAVNLDTSPYNYCRNNGNESLLVLYSYTHTKYYKWSNSNSLSAINQRESKPYSLR